MKQHAQQLLQQTTQQIKNYLQEIANDPQEWLDCLHQQREHDTKTKTRLTDLLEQTYGPQFINLLDIHYHTYQILATIGLTEETKKKEKEKE